MGVVMSFNAKLYRNTGTYGTPVWDLVPNVKDVSVPWDFNEVDVSRRAGGGFAESEPALTKISVDFDMIEDTADTDFTTFRDAAIAKTSIGMLVLNGLQATAGSCGLRAEMKFFKMGQGQKLDDAMRVEFSMKPCYSSNAPSWYTAS